MAKNQTEAQVREKSRRHIQLLLVLTSAVSAAQFALSLRAGAETTLLLLPLVTALLPLLCLYLLRSDSPNPDSKENSDDD